MLHAQQPLDGAEGAPVPAPPSHAPSLTGLLHTLPGAVTAVAMCPHPVAAALVEGAAPAGQLLVAAVATAAHTVELVTCVGCCSHDADALGLCYAHTHAHNKRAVMDVGGHEAPLASVHIVPHTYRVFITRIIRTC